MFTHLVDGRAEAQAERQRIAAKQRARIEAEGQRQRAAQAERARREAAELAAGRRV